MHPRPQPTTGAEAFARMLDGEAEVRSWDVADLDDLVDMVALARAMSSVESPQPRADFAANLRTQLLDIDVTTMRQPEPPVAETAAAVIDLAAARKRKATRRAYTAAAVGSMVLGTAGVAAAAQSALPGSPLYGVKRAIEGIELSFATSDNARGHDLLDQARTRLEEVRALSKSHASNTALIQQTLQAFSTSASEGTNLLFTNYQRRGDTSDLKAIQNFANTASVQLSSLSPEVVTQNRAQLREASSLVANVEQQSKLLCPTCAALPPLTEKFQKLAADDSQSSDLGPLLAGPPATVAKPVRTQDSTKQPTATTKPTKPTTTTRVPLSPSTSITTTTGVGKVVTGVLNPVTNTLTAVLSTTSNTTTALTNAVGTLLGAKK